MSNPHLFRSNPKTWTISLSGPFPFPLSSPLSHPNPHPLPSPFPISLYAFPFSPSKVQGFLWKVAWNRGPTLDAFNPSTLMFLSYGTSVLFIYQMQTRTITYSSIVLLVGNYRSSPSDGWLELGGPWQDSGFASVRKCFILGSCKKFGFCVCTSSYGRFGRS